MNLRKRKNVANHNKIYCVRKGNVHKKNLKEKIWIRKNKKIKKGVKNKTLYIARRESKKTNLGVGGVCTAHGIKIVRIIERQVTNAMHQRKP